MQLFLTVCLESISDVMPSPEPTARAALEAAGFSVASVVLRQVTSPGPCLVAATVVSDCGSIRFNFDAAPVFRGLDDDELVALAGIGWGGDQEADSVAEAAAELFQDVEDGMNAIDMLQPPHASADPIGFEVKIEPDQALAWLKVERPRVADLLTSQLAAEEMEPA